MRRSPGFTLLELLVVIGILSVLMGVAIGYLGKTDPRMVADAILGGELRAAQLTARADGVPTEVLLRPGGERNGAIEAATVQSRLLRPVVSFHFEPGEQVEDEVLRPVLLGEDVPAGRFGHGRRPAAEGKNTLLRWSVPPAVVTLADGFVVRFDVWLEQRSAGIFLRLPAAELTLDADGKPHAVVRLHGLAGDSTLRAPLASELALPLRQWGTLELGCDGRTAWLTYDGRTLAQAIAEGTPVHPADAALEVLPSDGPLDCVIDEMRWYVYGFASPQYFPAEVQLDRVYRFAFDARGEPVSQPKVRFGLPEEGS